MKLKAQIEDQRLLAVKEMRASKKGEGTYETAYFEGVIEALDWVMESRNNISLINGIEFNRKEKANELDG